jgi:hypothetical protein
MKIRLVNWLNLAAACLCFAAAVLGFIAGKPVTIVIACFDIIAGAWNAFVFLHAVAVWWHDSDFVLDNFVFTCPKCGQKQIPSFWDWFFVPHIGSRRYLKCQNSDCKKRCWMRRK